jgi:hypothetical protein
MPDIKKLIIMSVRAILPVAFLIILIQFTLVGVSTEIFIDFLIGIVLAIIGLILFFIGAHLGLLPLGEHFGTVLAKTGKLWILLPFAFVIGYAITVAEPSVRVLAGHAEAASGGGISKGVLVHTIGLGVAIFLCLAAFRIVKGTSIKMILTAGYTLVFILTIFAHDRFIPVSYDAGGVTTGTVTVPFVLALGMGMAFTLRGKDASSESFGLVALASLGPILAMLILGIFLK